MAGARCDSGRLSKPVWTASCGPRPPVGAPALRKRCERRGVGSVGAALAGAVPDGTAESVADEGDRERDLLRAPIRLRLAALARQLPAAADSLRLVPAAARRLRSGAAEPPSGHARPRAQRARRQPFGGGGPTPN